MKLDAAGKDADGALLGPWDQTDFRSLLLMLHLLDPQCPEVHYISLDKSAEGNHSALCSLS